MKEMQKRIQEMLRKRNMYLNILDVTYDAMYGLEVKITVKTYNNDEIEYNIRNLLTPEELLNRLEELLPKEKDK